MSDMKISPAMLALLTDSKRIGNLREEIRSLADEWLGASEVHIVDRDEVVIMATRMLLLSAAIRLRETLLGHVLMCSGTPGDCDECATAKRIVMPQ